jgi:hypothetical protein
MQRRIIIDLVEGDTAPDLPVRFRGMDLSLYSLIEMHVVTDNGNRFSRTVTPDGSDPELGTVAWQSGDLVRGRHRAEFEFTQLSDGKKLTIPRRYPVHLNVREDLL